MFGILFTFEGYIFDEETDTGYPLHKRGKLACIGQKPARKAQVCSYE